MRTRDARSPPSPALVRPRPRRPRRAAAPNGSPPTARPSSRSSRRTRSSSCAAPAEPPVEVGDAYRADSNFWYLTGFPEPDAIAVLRPVGSGGEALSPLRAAERVEDRAVDGPPRGPRGREVRPPRRRVVSGRGLREGIARGPPRREGALLPRRGRREVPREAPDGLEPDGARRDGGPPGDGRLRPRRARCAS